MSTTRSSRTYRVYCITNLRNQKRYVGQTWSTLEERFKRHEEASRCGSRLLVHKAMQKHGVKAFEIKEIITTDDEGQANVLETTFVARLRSHMSEHGYNMTLGGDGYRATRATRAAAMARKNATSINELGALHAKVVATYNAQDDNIVTIASTFNIKPRDVKTLLQRHRRSTCAVCFDDENMPIVAGAEVSRARLTKPKTFSAKVSSWKKNSRHTKQQRIDQMLLLRGMTLEEARDIDARVIELRQHGTTISGICSTLGLKSTLVGKIIERHGDASCPLCF